MNTVYDDRHLANTTTADYVTIASDQRFGQFTKLLDPISESDMKPNTIVKSDNGGLRYDEGKPRYDLIPPEAIEAIAVHYMQGAKKYADRNWERGMDWGKCFRALMSHAIKWQKGETYDNDPSMPGYEAHHMIAVAWNAIALYIYQTRGIGRDDRNIVKKD